MIFVQNEIFLSDLIDTFPALHLFYRAVSLRCTAQDQAAGESESVMKCAKSAQILAAEVADHILIDQ